MGTLKKAAINLQDLQTNHKWNGGEKYSGLKSREIAILFRKWEKTESVDLFCDLFGDYHLNASLNTTRLTSSSPGSIITFPPHSYNLHFLITVLSLISHTSFVHFSSNPLPWVGLEPCIGWTLKYKMKNIRFFNNELTIMRHTKSWVWAQLVWRAQLTL